MKLFKIVPIILLSILVTGCYTQLQYSQTMEKVTDEKQPTKAGVYSWSGEEKAEQQTKNNEDSNVVSDTVYEEYIPIYYKDYAYADKYGDIYVNNYYGDWLGYDYYRSYPTFHSFYFDRWFFRNYYSPWYPRSSFAFSISIGWGNPYYYSPYYYNHFYDPFFGPFDYHWYGIYSSPYTFHYRYYYGKSGYGFGYYPDKKIRQNKNIRYGPRSIGTNRVSDSRNRSRSVTTDGRPSSVSKSSPTVRTRTTGTLRTRSSGSTVKSRSKNKRTNTKRTRENRQVQKYDYNVYIDRTDQRQRSVVINEKQLKEVRSRLNNTDNKNQTYRSRFSTEREQRSSFFNRMRNFLQENTIQPSSRNNSTLRTRSSFPLTNNRAKVNRNSGSNRSSVTKSRSSSSNSRSRGGSSSSRSRSDNGSSSSSDRSRGNR